MEGCPEVLLTASDDNVAFLYDIPVELVVELGRARLTVRELAGLDSSDVLPLEQLVGQPLDVLVGGKLFGRGELIVEDERVGIRFVEFADGKAAR